MASAISQDKLNEMLAKIRASRAATAAQEITITPNVPHTPAPDEQTSTYSTYDRYGNLITYNQQQKDFLDTVSKGASAVLIGPAGTGKTTVMRGAIETLLASPHLVIEALNAPHKHLPAEAPGIVIISFTRRAITNIKRVLPENLKANAITYHKLMEYEPSFSEVEDPETHEVKNTMQFLPARNAYNPLPQSIHTIIVEEASMLSLEYFDTLLRALTHEVQFIFLGDIYQLPPVFGSAILGFKMVELKTVELVHVYRQALESPIIKLATDVRRGITQKFPEKVELKSDQGILTVHPWAKKIHAEDATIVAGKFMTTAIEAGVYNPYEDVILLPFNKAFGTIELNARIATYLAKKEDKEVHEVIAGFEKHYFRVGERIMYDKADAEILQIIHNSSYGGAKYQPASKHLDYFGCLQDSSQTHHVEDMDESEIDFILDQVAASKDEDRVHAASHKIQIRLLDTEQVLWLEKAADINAILLGYAITVHKAQGSEWSKVFLFLHHSHATMLSRELIYTAITRARNELYVVCEKETFVSGVKSQRIKGNTLAEKAEVFKGKLEEINRANRTREGA